MSTPLGRFPPEILALDEEIGHFMEYWGFKRIHGRVWLHLYLSDTPLDVSELMRRLKVSKTLLSFCMKELKEYAVIIETGMGRHGTVFYQANPDLQSVIQNVLRIRERPLLGKIKVAHTGVATLPESEVRENNLSPKRIKELGKLVNSAERSLRTLSNLSLIAGSAGGGLLDLLSRMSGGSEK
ncbi:MAG: hypothetical protein H7301_04250 [Cryobacterium sp.]|nr:hypothetical protein [Oligoflexia bacterium]